VQVQLFHGLVDNMGEIPRPNIVLMSTNGKAPDGAVWLFQGTIPCGSSGQHGYIVRVLPRHPDLANAFEPGLVCWG
jgi:starch phosphorylase